jgi:outer membrane lipoprotein SlyB
MRKILLALSAASMIATTAIIPTTPAQARKHYNNNRYGNNYGAREWRGRDGRTYCRRSNGTTGLVVGGVAGALVGNGVAGRGDKTLGTVIGGVAGALGGRAIDRSSTRDRRCR